MNERNNPQPLQIIDTQRNDEGIDTENIAKKINSNNLESIDEVIDADEKEKTIILEKTNS
jgi:hypothetical protein